MLKKWSKQQPGGRGLKQTGRDSPLAQSPGFQPLLKHLPPLPGWHLYIVGTFNFYSSGFYSILKKPSVSH